jgi:hypothetical protein
MAEPNFSSSVPPQDLIPCLKCGAMNYPSSTKCWVCFAPVSHEQPIIAELVQPPPLFASQSLQLFTSILVPVLLGVACIGATMGGQVIPQVASVLALVSACITIGIGIRRKTLGGALLSLLISVSLGILLLTAVVFGAIILLFIACINAM